MQYPIGIKRSDKLFALLSPLLTVWILSCSSTSTTDDQGKYPLWKLQGESNTIWLLGSVHMLPESAHPFPAAFETAYKEADRLVFEMTLDQENQFGMLMKLMGSAMLPTGQTLQDVVSEETWELLEPKLDEIAQSLVTMMSEVASDKLDAEDMGTDIVKMTLMRMKPWFISFLIQGSEASVGDYRPDLGVDLYYMNKAKEDGKPTSGLETETDQLGFLEEMAGENSEEFLRSVLEMKGSGSDELDKLVDAWKKGDLEKLNELVNGSISENTHVYETLIVNRNKRWVPQIIDLFNDQDDYLIIVGAGHLIGDQSVIAMLREKGYSVVRQ